MFNSSILHQKNNYVLGYIRTAYQEDWEVLRPLSLAFLMVINLLMVTSNFGDIVWSLEHP